MMNNIYAIGDIHGCFDKLIRLMEKIPIDYATDTLIFLGDYIDRGAQSYDVVEYLIQLKNEQKDADIVFLKGNHEEMLLHYLAGEDRQMYMVNGGQETIRGYIQRNNGAGTFPIPAEHRDFFSSLSLYHETDHYIFVHAGLREQLPLEYQLPEDVLWIRGKFIQSDYDFGKKVVFGHTPFPKPLIEPNKIGIDTGAVYGNQLTCVKLPDLVFYQV